MTRPESAPRGELLFLPLGGAGEIGMNLNLYGFGGRWIMVDCGIAFADDSMPGVDLVLPDPRFIEERSEDLLGLFLTHAHEDHIGAVPYLWPRLRCPVYATPFTAALVAGKLERAGLSGDAPLNVVPVAGSVAVGDFDVRYVPITHSIPEAHSLGIRTPAGTVVHTGDWKLDPAPVVGEATDAAPFRAFGDDGVLALVCDSTNVFRPGRSGSERTVRENMEEIVAGAKGRVAITTFASNVARIKSVLAIAEACGRHAVLAGPSMRRTLDAARATGHIDPGAAVLADRDAGRLPPERTLLLCAGCQGEPRGAMSRIAFGDHPHVRLEAGDVAIFSSKIIPGNERAIARAHDRLVLSGVDVITEKDRLVHTSGHPSRDELGEMYSWIRPQLAVPVHGEFRHLNEHSRFALDNGARNAVVVRNGDVLRLSPDPGVIVDRAPAGRLALDGRGLVAEDSDNLRMRRRLSFNGFVAVTVVLDAGARAAARPRVLARGVPGTEGSDFESRAVARLDRELRALPRARRADDAAIDDLARRTLRRLLRPLTAARPPIDVDVVRLEAHAAEDGRAEPRRRESREDSHD